MEVLDANERQALGIEVRAGLHTGECEVLVSSTLRDLVTGSGLQFDERGTHELKGVPGQWNLYAVAG